MKSKVAGEFEESDILFAHVVENSDGADFLTGEAVTREAYDLAARTSKLAL